MAKRKKVKSITPAAKRAELKKGAGKQKAIALLTENIRASFINTDMGSGWRFVLREPNRKDWLILDEHKYLDMYEGLDDESSKEDEANHYAEWKEDFKQESLKSFKEMVIPKHLHIFEEELQRDKFKDGGAVGEHFVGKFTVQQLAKKEDKVAIDKAMQTTGLKYIKNKIIKKGGKPHLMEVYLTDKMESGGKLQPTNKTVWDNATNVQLIGNGELTGSQNYEVLYNGRLYSVEVMPQNWGDDVINPSYSAEEFNRQGGAVGIGKKYKTGDFVFTNMDTRNPESKTPFIVARWSGDAYYIMGDGSHYVAEDKLTPATEKDFSDYYGDVVTQSYKNVFGAKVAKFYMLSGGFGGEFPYEVSLFNSNSKNMYGHPDDFFNHDTKKFKTYEAALEYAKEQTNNGAQIYKGMENGGSLWNWDSLNFKVGDVVTAKNTGTYTIIGANRGYYLFRSDNNGNPIVGDNWGRIIHSNSFLGEIPTKIGHRELESEKRTIGGKEYVYFLSGNEDIDTQMATSDARWNAFRENATKSMMRKFDESESINDHYEAAKMVANWFDNNKFEDGGSVGSKYDGMTAMQILRHEKSNLAEENLILKQLLKNGFFYVNYGGTDCDGCSSENHRKFTSLDEFNKWRYNDNDAEGSFYASVVREGEPLNEDVSGGYWGMAKGGSLNKKIMFGWF